MRSLHTRQENPTQNSTSTDVFNAASGIQIPNNFYSIAEQTYENKVFLISSLNIIICIIIRSSIK
jgi:hypothetical protein